MKTSRKLWTVGGLVVLLVCIILFLSWAFIALESVSPAIQSDLHAHHNLEPTQEGNFFINLFKVYVPRRQCMFFEPTVIWMHFVSDILIAGAYFTIPLALIYFIRRRRDLSFSWVFWMFAGFILACGTTHLFAAADLWVPLYRVEGVTKLITAALSVATAIALWPLIPKALAIPTKKEIEENVINKTVTESERNFRLLANTIPQLAWMANPDGWIFWYNARWYDYTGKTPTDMEGWGWQSVHDPEVLPSVISQWKHSIRTGEMFDMTFPLRGADGEYRPFLTRISPLKDSDGNVMMWFGTNTDLTEERKIAEERQQLLEAEKRARAEAEKTSNIKDEFLATLSHELRTPLNAIVGWSQLLKQGGDQEKLSKGAAVIERNARIQVQLIEDLLDMSRIISGNLRIDVQRVELAEIIDSAIESVRPAAAARQIRIEQILDTHVGAVRGDPARLQQVFWNLLTNALKFTGKGGKIQVALERVNSHVEVTVTDNGIGIHPEFLPLVFDRFKQADSSTTRNHGGLGIGLSIVKNLVELHGGSVRAKSPGEGLGSTFSVELPLMIVHQGNDEELSRRHPRDSLTSDESTTICLDGLLKNVTVLVVDDEKDARELIYIILSECKAIVLLASSAQEGIEILRKKRPNVIISDIGMAKEDGLAFMRRVRELPEEEGGKTPAAALTAFVRSEDRRRALVAGYQLHLAKPIDPSELITVVASLAGKIGNK